MRYLLALVVFTTTLVAAPVPKRSAVAVTDPCPISGTWVLDWWSMKDGVIHFQEDGYFWYQHNPTGPGFYYGQWQLDGKRLSMQEWYVNSDGQRVWTSTLNRVFTITLDTESGGWLLEKGVVIHKIVH